jgi:hypothetical protein
MGVLGTWRTETFSLEEDRKIIGRRSCARGGGKVAVCISVKGKVSFVCMRENEWCSWRECFAQSGCLFPITFIAKQEWYAWGRPGVCLGATVNMWNSFRNYNITCVEPIQQQRAATIQSASLLHNTFVCFFRFLFLLRTPLPYQYERSFYVAYFLYIYIYIRGSSVSIVTRLWTGRPRFNSQQGQGRNFSLRLTASRPTLGPIQPRIQWVLALFPRE